MGVVRNDLLSFIMTNVRAAQVKTEGPIWMRQVLADLERHEGYREYAYPDPLSKLGKLYPASKYRWGFRPASVIMAELGITKTADGAPWTVGIGFTHGVTHTSRTTRPESYARLQAEVVDHVKGLDKLLPGWRTSHSIAIQTVLVNMIYNLGELRLSKFAPTLDLIKKHDYAGAAARIEKTPYYKQIGERGRELMERLRTGKIQDKYKV